MLPFTNIRLNIPGFDHNFYYDPKSLIPEVIIYSMQMAIDLKSYLNIQHEINSRIVASTVVSGQTNFYDALKITRIETLYDFYIDQVLSFMQTLYYVTFNQANIYALCADSVKLIEKYHLDGTIPDFSTITTKEEELNKFKNSFAKNAIKSGFQLTKCFERALEKCKPLKTMIEDQINFEFPIVTLQDRVVKQEKKIATKKK